MAYYLNLPAATPEQEQEAMKEAAKFMDDGGRTLYSSCRSTAVSAIFDYLLYTKGVRANRSSS